MARSLEDRHVVVTGGIGGLGEAVVGAFVAAGAQVHIPNFFDAVPASFAYAEHPQVHIAGSIDLSNEAAVVDYYAAIDRLWASVHLAGGFAMSAVVDTSIDDFRQMFERNTVTCFLSCREAVRAMRRRGDGDGGRIVNVAARPVVAPVGGMVSYSTSKAGVAAITQALAAELTSERILVNAVLPSIIDTPANRSAMPDADHATWPKPAQLAEAILFLASPANALTSGALLPVYGRA